MSFLGKGVLLEGSSFSDSDPENELNFIRRKFEVGGRTLINIPDELAALPDPTCVLCGMPIQGHQASSMEHPLPQWLFRFSGDVGDRPAFGVSPANNRSVNWRQLCLNSHSSCNSTFGRLIEDPIISPFKRLIEGAPVTNFEVDKILDWFDKIKCASAHMGNAVAGQNLILRYEQYHFPNKRIGRFDRLLQIMRVGCPEIPLSLFNCTSDWFITTPASLCLKVKDVIFVYSTGQFLLSHALGLWDGTIEEGQVLDEGSVCGSRIFSTSFGWRETLIPDAVTIAQPMRYWLQEFGFKESCASSLKSSGEGFIWQLGNQGWYRPGQITVPQSQNTNDRLALLLCMMESLEWIEFNKLFDDYTYPTKNRHFMDSYQNLVEEISELRKLYLTISGDANHIF